MAKTRTRTHKLVNMIKLLEIDPIDRSSPYKLISELEVDFVSKFQSSSNPQTYLNNAITKRKKKRVLTPHIKKEILVLQYLKKNIWKLLIEKPNELHLRIKYLEKRRWQKLIYDHKMTKFGIELLDIFGYRNRFRSNKNRGIWLARQLNIKSCPYCNAQSTIIAATTLGNDIAKFQFDHFFSKDKYPYLSISLYNLIPACVNCNITKSSKLLDLKNHYHPYFSDLSICFKFYLKYNPDPKKLNLSQVKLQNLDIEIVPKYPLAKSFVDTHNNLYHINGVYERYQDIAEELLIKSIIYTKHFQATQLKIKNLFPDESTYLRYLIGAYPSSGDMLKRPLSKFTQDIAKQLKLY